MRRPLTPIRRRRDRYGTSCWQLEQARHGVKGEWVAVRRGGWQSAYALIALLVQAGVTTLIDKVTPNPREFPR